MIKHIQQIIDQAYHRLYMTPSNGSCMAHPCQPSRNHHETRNPIKVAAIATLTIASTFVSFSPLMMSSARADSNFGTVSVSASPNESIEGYTGGSVPLFSILNVREDVNGESCVGYAEREPDHILSVSQPLSRITIEVESNGSDTTLMIEAPDETVYCGDDGNDSDAVIEGRQWAAGEYKVWVGTFDAGQAHNYTLEID